MQYKNYFEEIRKRFLSGDFTEHTFRTPFENFIKSLSNTYGIISEPKRKEGIGAPDFKVFKNARKIGYIETKDLNKNLDQELKSEQIEKYSKSINNIILTNYGRLILIRAGEKVFDITLFNFSDLKNDLLCGLKSTVSR